MKNLEVLLSLSFYRMTVSLPTLGFVDRNRLEVYGDSNEVDDGEDPFGNLTFHFSCKNKSVGFYADPGYNCRIFHACDEHGEGLPIICPNDTFFDQKRRICTDEGEDGEINNCDRAADWYYLNDLPYSNELADDHKPQSLEDDQVPTVVPLSLT